MEVFLGLGEGGEVRQQRRAGEEFDTVAPLHVFISQ
jgi:hypothetical protein